MAASRSWAGSKTRDRLCSTSAKNLARGLEPRSVLMPCWSVAPSILFGNLEPRKLFTGHTDVVVCDGFIGNIVLNLHEGWAANWCQFMERSPPLDGLSAAVKTSLRQYCRHLESRFDYQDVGGTPLLGVRGTVVVAHGCSRAPAIANAIHVAVRALECQSVARVVEYLETTPILSELKHYSARWVLDHWKSRWGGRKKHS
jgi:hypothetical protein